MLIYSGLAHDLIFHPCRDKVAVEYVRVNVGPVTPDDCSKFGIDLHGAKQRRIAPQWLKYRATQIRIKVNSLF